MAFYLKYRPQSLADLLGQDLVKKNLESAFLNKKLAHAYLLVGPRGTGKTSTARILAKMVNCEYLDNSGQPVSAKADQKTELSSAVQLSVPCNKCPTCLSITDGSNLDLIEIDAASNRGIDDMRELRDKIKLSPTSSPKKVYIIDEVHMLTEEAFNALLKTLEEPPDHVLFVLATTDVEKIPATILSRVQRLDFKLAAKVDLLESLKKIAKAEKLEIEEKALDFFTQKAEGSFRDAVKLLDQAAALGQKITTENLSSHFSVTKFEVIVELLNNLASHNSKQALLTLNQLSYDPKELILSLMESLRQLLLVQNGLEVSVKEDLGSDRFVALKQLAEKFKLADFFFSLEKLQEAIERLKFSPIPSLPLELAVIEICNNTSNESERAKVDVAPTEWGSVTSKAQASPDPPAGVSGPRATENQASERKINKVSNSPDMVILQEKWGFVLETIKPFNFSLEALLRSVKIQSCEEGVVVLEVPYSFHQRILETPKSRDLLESVFSDVLGKSAKITTVLGTRPIVAEEMANVEIAADDEILRAAAEIFNGKLVD
ncbi:MAG: DNA polymerase III subunit gamma/tau [Candidatus Daviesbacteria bacterium]|nr:MAG: DNA polymerase III subunit gamma/tau [Candidatus Daviesbacteria bacterium]